MSNIKFEYGFESINGIVKKKYFLHEIPDIKQKCDVWNVLPIVYVRQFTGAKDKNGIEIYNGDICKFHIKGKEWVSVVDFGTKSHGFKLKVKYHTYTEITKYYAIPNPKHIEVIGNIYETDLNKTNETN